MSDSLSSINHIGPQIQQNILQSEFDGGVWLEDVPVGSTVLVQTANTLYTLRHTPDGWTIQGHERYCPVEVPVSIAGSTWGGSILKIGFLGVGMYMEFTPEGIRGPITSSLIRTVEAVPTTTKDA